MRQTSCREVDEGCLTRNKKDSDKTKHDLQLDHLKDQSGALYLPFFANLHNNRSRAYSRQGGIGGITPFLKAPSNFKGVILYGQREEKILKFK